MFLKSCCPPILNSSPPFEQLNEDSYSKLDVKAYNYSQVDRLTLDNNHLETLSEKLFDMKLHSLLSARNNKLTSVRRWQRNWYILTKGNTILNMFYIGLFQISYDFAKRLRGGGGKLIKLGLNPWLCSCSGGNPSEITVKVWVKRTLDTVIGEDGNFFRGGAGPQFSSRRGRDLST